MGDDSDYPYYLRKYIQIDVSFSDALEEAPH